MCCWVVTAWPEPYDFWIEIANALCVPIALVATHGLRASTEADAGTQERATD